jgi:hypothetical protein
MLVAQKQQGGQWSSNVLLSYCRVMACVAIRCWVVATSYHACGWVNCSKICKSNVLDQSTASAWYLQAILSLSIVTPAASTPRGEARTRLPALNREDPWRNETRANDRRSF